MGSPVEFSLVVSLVLEVELVVELVVDPLVLEVVLGSPELELASLELVPKSVVLEVPSERDPVGISWVDASSEELEASEPEVEPGTPGEMGVQAPRKRSAENRDMPVSTLPWSREIRGPD